MTPPAAPTSSATTASAARARGSHAPAEQHLAQAQPGAVGGGRGGRPSASGAAGGPRPTGLSGSRHGSTAAPSAQNGGVGADPGWRRAGRALQGGLCPVLGPAEGAWRGRPGAAAGRRRRWRGGRGAPVRARETAVDAAAGGRTPRRPPGRPRAAPAGAAPTAAARGRAPAAVLRRRASAGCARSCCGSPLLGRGRGPDASRVSLPQAWSTSRRRRVGGARSRRAGPRAAAPGARRVDGRRPAGARRRGPCRPAAD